MFVLVTLYQDCSSCDDSSKKRTARGRGLFSPIYLYRKLLKSSCQKPLDRFQYLAEMFLWWPSTKIVQAVLIRQKTWPPGGRALFSPLYSTARVFLQNLIPHSTDFLSTTFPPSSLGKTTHLPVEHAVGKSLFWRARNERLVTSEWLTAPNFSEFARGGNLNLYFAYASFGLFATE